MPATRSSMVTASYPFVQKTRTAFSSAARSSKLRGLPRGRAISLLIGSKILDDRCPQIIVLTSSETRKGPGPSARKKKPDEKETGNEGAHGSHGPRRQGTVCFCARREDRWDAHRWDRRARLPLECQ